MSEMTATHKEKLMTDLKLVIADAEELMKLTAGDVGEKASAIRMRMQARMEQAKVDLARLQENAVARAKDASKVADNYVHDNPWTAIGIAAGVGVVLGMLISRR
ncbi:MAG: protein of unknown function ElaB [Ramlibacter sp.]|jgi:ElaB/YqjD/DUF883 family membrane-anchored ribosome-binding protein|nr:protein of unknown function ElaB [Ramlibacter sp.]